ncbi:MAG: hypothetical protein JSR80_05860 [Verrucomicrobia bacterium]|nr:hypothetical protein [Verrucomicrobiota bacterium]
MRFLFSCIHLLLLFAVPITSLYGQPSYAMKNVGVLSCREDFTLDTLPRYDQLLQFLDRIEAGTLPMSKTGDLRETALIVATLARQGMLPGETEENIELENDIKSLLEDNPYENCWGFADSNEYSIVPALFCGEGEMLLCRSWVGRGWSKVRHFVRKHKKVLIIGIAVALAVTLGVCLINAIAKEEAQSAPTAAVPSEGFPQEVHTEHQLITPTSAEAAIADPPPVIPDFLGIEGSVDDKIFALKTVMAEEGSAAIPERSWKEKAKHGASKLSHELFSEICDYYAFTFDAVTALNKLTQKFFPGLSDIPALQGNPSVDLQRFEAFGHGKLDVFWSTDLASEYTPEEKAARREASKHISYGIMPPPMFFSPGNVGIAKEVMKDSQKAAAIAKELGYTRREIKHLTNNGKLEKTVGDAFERVVTSPQAYASFQKIKKAEKFLEPYSKKYMPEQQVRELIHKTGLKTFPKPKGIPEQFVVTISDKGAGMKYVHPTNTHTYIRVMPGKPHSPFPYQQKPYVNHRVNGQSLDKYGKVVLNDSLEAHIPIDEFIYRGN